jgi:hypothetical protein
MLSPGTPLRTLVGFGAQRGGEGHLNHDGHALMGRVLAKAIAEALPALRAAAGSGAADR